MQQTVLIQINAAGRAPCEGLASLAPDREGQIMLSLRFRTAAAVIAVAAVIAPVAPAQQASPPILQSDAAGPALTQQQLDQLVAPVALYPDPLLVDIMTAATYPLEVVEAQRWVSDPANAALKGDALTKALAALDWDPSVKSLVPFPKVLQMLDAHLDWTQRLGEAFLAQQADVMDAVQRMRRRAEEAGSLKTTPQEAVTDANGIIAIAPPAQMIYVPVYDAWCVYGPWPYAVYPPYYFEPWPGECLPSAFVVGFDLGIFWPFIFWEWGFFDWRHHHIGIHHHQWDLFGHGRMGDVWQHQPEHRGGVPYRDLRNARQFQPQRDYQRSFRGYERRGGEAAPTLRPTPPAFGNYGSGREMRMQSERGQESLRPPSGGAPSLGGGHGGVGHGGYGGFRR
jgi:hypothetical protein